jgi:virulence-associated protein VagC
MHGRSQAVRLPLAFRLPGDRVRVRRVEGGILLEPIVTDLDTWFAELDRFADVPFMEDEARGGHILDPMEANAADALAVLLGCDRNDGLALDLSAPFVVFRATDVGSSISTVPARASRDQRSCQLERMPQRVTSRWRA